VTKVFLQLWRPITGRQPHPQAQQAPAGLRDEMSLPITARIFEDMVAV
jgi:hypothetical protein